MEEEFGPSPPELPPMESFIQVAHKTTRDKKAAQVQAKDEPGIAEAALERIHLEESLGHSLDDDADYETTSTATDSGTSAAEVENQSAETEEEKVDADAEVEKMRMEEEFGPSPPELPPMESFIQVAQKTTRGKKAAQVQAKDEPGIAEAALERSHLGESLGHSLDDDADYETTSTATDSGTSAADVENQSAESEEEKVDADAEVEKMR